MAKGPNFQSSQRSSVSQPVQLAQKQLIVFFTLLSLPSIAQSFWGVVWDRQLYQFDIPPTDDNHVRPCRCSHNVLRHGGRRIVTCSKTREVSIQLLILGKECLDTMYQTLEDTIMAPSKSALVQSSRTGIEDMKHCWMNGSTKKTLGSDLYLQRRRFRGVGRVSDAARRRNDS